MSTRGSQGDVRERIVDDYSGYRVYDERGEKLGKVEYTVLDERGEPEYLGVKTGFFGTKTTLLPERVVSLNSDTGEFRAETSESQVKDAPTFDREEDITPDFEDRIREHYGLRSRRETTAPEYSGEERRERSDREGSQRRTDRNDRDDFGTSGSDERLAETRRGGSDEEVRDRESRDREDRDREDRESRGRDRGESRDRESRDSGPEQVRVTLKREKVRAERVVGEDGEEEVRIRKQVVEEEQLVDVEDHRDD